jgi:predicted patatin/cPLA2 family phospholipase
METHPVIEIIKKRHFENSEPGQRKDNFKIGLVIEGGGMRGVVGASMATALHYLGLVNAFDAVYGSSAGALAGSLFVTHNMPLGPTIYYEDLVRKEFINLLNVFSSQKPIMSLDYLMKDILQGEKALNWEYLIESKIRLNIVVSSISKRKLLSVNDYKTKEELFTLLKASATIPFVAGSPVKYKDDLLFDASIYGPIPFLSAINDGCTHVLVLLTRPQGVQNGEASFIEKYYFAPKLKKLNPGLEIDYLQRSIAYYKNLEFLYNENQYVNNSPCIYSVFLSKENKPVSGLEKNKKTLINAAIAGMQAIMDIFIEKHQTRYHEVLCPFDKYGLIPKMTIGIPLRLPAERN